MHPNAQLITRFYEAFARRDAPAMAACYHPAARFSDPAFPNLKGPEVGLMWNMLIRRGTDLVVRFSDVRADDATGLAHWDADYTFSKTGRLVRNHIDASFKFRDGLIVEHHDHFDFHRWAAQALGPMGRLLGGTRWLQRKVQRTAAEGLATFAASREKR